MTVPYNYLKYNGMYGLVYGERWLTFTNNGI